MSTWEDRARLEADTLAGVTCALLALLEVARGIEAQLERAVDLYRESRG